MLTRLLELAIVVTAVTAALALPALTGSWTLTAAILAVGLVVVVVVIGAFIFMGSGRFTRDFQLSDASPAPPPPPPMGKRDRLVLQQQPRRKSVPLPISIPVGLAFIAFGVFDLYFGERLPGLVNVGFMISGGAACGVQWVFPEGLLRALGVRD